jgi:2,3-bisphosphoglycerate-dependent phosphoglycerate mutase
MRLYFIRHGQSGNNLLWLRTRSTKGRSEDPELTETGWQQAQALAQYLRDATDDVVAEDDGRERSGFGITHLYCSLMVRSVATATVVSQVLDLPLVAWEDLHEGGGIWLEDAETGERVGRAGKSRPYFETHYPHLRLPERLDDQGWWSRPFEPYESRPDRARRFLARLLEKHGQSEDRVGVVSHGGFYTYLMTALLGLPEDDSIWFAMNNAAITRVDFEDERVGLVYSNRVEFLPQELVT